LGSYVIAGIIMPNQCNRCWLAGRRPCPRGSGRSWWLQTISPRAPTQSSFDSFSAAEHHSTSTTTIRHNKIAT